MLQFNIRIHLYKKGVKVGSRLTLLYKSGAFLTKSFGGFFPPNLQGVNYILYGDFLGHRHKGIYLSQSLW